MAVLRTFHLVQLPTLPAVTVQQEGQLFLNLLAASAAITLQPNNQPPNPQPTGNEPGSPAKPAVPTARLRHWEGYKPTQNIINVHISDLSISREFEYAIYGFMLDGVQFLMNEYSGEYLATIPASLDFDYVIERFCALLREYGLIVDETIFESRKAVDQCFSTIRQGIVDIEAENTKKGE